MDKAFSNPYLICIVHELFIAFNYSSLSKFIQWERIFYKKLLINSYIGFRYLSKFI